MPEIILVQCLVAMARHRAAMVRADQRGEITEKVIITAIFAALAIAVGGIIVAKVTSKANSIPTE
ncbi:MAG: hypothetical protein M3P85_14665 [Actinomycetota bacterium]|nr:hypothetical protein [Actinomycetota bacterium]